MIKTLEESLKSQSEAYETLKAEVDEALKNEKASRDKADQIQKSFNQMNHKYISVIHERD